MAESITQRLNGTQLDSISKRQLQALLEQMRADQAAIVTQFNQLRTDYNANATIATDTTATAITPGTTA